MSTESEFQVKVHLQQIVTIAVKGDSQMNAEEKIRRFFDTYSELDDSQRKMVPSFPFEAEEIEFEWLEVLDDGAVPMAIKNHNEDLIKRGSPSELQELMNQNENITKEYIKERREEDEKEIDISDPEKFAKIKKIEKTKFKE